ncbi:MAG: periplasmic heavy metal sensor [Bryobacterales bacterium]|nr:periplasmic heavy metal sensor [Bryobacterales bacterium]
MRLHRLVTGLAATVLLAQTPPGAARSAPERAPGIAAVKAYLRLSDQQVEQLIQLRREEQQFVQPIREQIRAKAQDLRTLMESGSPDPASVGRLVLALRDLRKQAAGAAATYHEKALAVLDSVQKEKLENLLKAADRTAGTRRAVNGARLLNLLPPPGRPRAGAAPQPYAGGGAGVGRGSGGAPGRL